MNGHEISRTHRRTWRRAAIAGVAIVGALAAAGATAAASEAGSCRAGPTREQVEERRALERVVAMMPTGWRATEVMRLQLDQPIGDDAQRDRLRHAVELMPVGWRVTEVLRAELEQEDCNP